MNVMLANAAMTISGRLLGWKGRLKAMISTYYGEIQLTCDICSEPVDEKFYDYQEAIDYKKANGWKSEKKYGEWFEVCPECQKTK